MHYCIDYERAGNMAIKKNKFEGVVEMLDAEEDIELEKSRKVISKIAGVGKRNRQPAVRRQAVSAYIPENLYGDFVKITSEYGISMNAGICQALREYVLANKEKLGI